jgi:hypothetical protein
VQLSAMLSSSMVMPFGIPLIGICRIQRSASAAQQGFMWLPMERTRFLILLSRYGISILIEFTID